MEAEVRERLAVLEAAHGALTGNQERILAELKEIRSELTRYRGFVGGVSFVVSGAMIALGLFKGWLFGKARRVRSAQSGSFARQPREGFGVGIDDRSRLRKRAFAR